MIAGTSSSFADKLALTAFVVDNDDLDSLRALLDRFNLFEALGVVRRELTHSNVLAFLLDPSQTHGLDDAVSRRFLQRVLLQHPDAGAPVSPIDLELWTLSNAKVHREWWDIDLLLVDEARQLVVVIENKIDSREHSDQLRRYRRIVETRFPDFRKLFLYLTPDGAAPSDDAYLAVGYRTVADTIEAVAAGAGSMADPGVAVLMGDYARMLRRHVVADSEIAELCRRIYLRHRRAIDLIIEHRPDRQADVRAFLIELIQAAPGLLLDRADKQYVRFAPESWDHPSIPTGRGWTSSNRMLLVQLDNFPDYLELSIEIGPGNDEDRQRLIDRAQANVPPFGPEFRLVEWRGRKWTQIYRRRWLAETDLIEMNWSELTERVHERFTSFVAEDLPRLVPLMVDKTS